MSDLISRSNIHNYIKAQINPYGKPFEGTVFEFGVKVMDYVENVTPVEAKPVVRGEWEQITEWDVVNDAIFECTNCRHKDVHAKGVVVPYCWYCGADMRGGK